jgi:CheY-like chemotaxis protein
MPENTEKNDWPWILVVDDSRLVRKAISKHLDKRFNILEAVHGLAAWNILSHDSRIDLVITDIQMPEMDGYALICKIRAAEDPGLREMPVITITSADDDTTRDRAYACGSNDFILKPFKTNQLMKCVCSQLEEYQAAAAELSDAEAPRSNTAQKVVSVVPNNNTGTLPNALTHIDAGLKILSGLKTAEIAPHALTLTLRFLPLLKYCNQLFGLGMDREIATIHQRITETRNKALAQNKKNSAA